MQNLSNETIIQIYRDLNQQDQAQGRLLRRSFNTAIRDIHYQTVYLYSARALDSLAINVIEDPTIATRIQRLIINFPEDEALLEDEMDIDENSQQARARERRLRRMNVNINKNNANELLRATHHLISLHSSVSGILTRGQATLPLTTRIEFISEADNASIVHHLLSAGECPRLSALRSTTFSNYPMLRMAPGLRTLYLTRLDVHAMAIDFTSFELIHRQMPLLQSLRLSNLNFQGRLIFPQNFQVAPHIRHFSTNIAHGALNILQYITRKYPGLTSLEYEIGTLMSTNNQIMGLHLEGWLPFFARFGASLERLSYGTHFRHFEFTQAMDAAQCQINFLSLDRVNEFSLITLAMSRQAEFIETLILEETDCQEFQWLPHFTNLRKLKLVSCRQSPIVAAIQLSQVLALAHETLHSLSLESLAFVLDDADVENQNITSLSFHDVFVNRQAADNIGVCFPSLNRLKVKLSLVEAAYINLTGFDLAELHFAGVVVFAGNSRHLTVLTEADNVFQRYTVENYDRKAIDKDVVSLVDPTYEIPFRSETLTIDVAEQQNVEFEFLLICNTLRRVIFA